MAINNDVEIIVANALWICQCCFVNAQLKIQKEGQARR